MKAPASPDRASRIRGAHDTHPPFNFLLSLLPPIKTTFRPLAREVRSYFTGLRPLRSLRLLAALAVAGLGAGQIAQAADTAATQWIGGTVGNPTNWGTATNWTGAGAVAGGPNSPTLSVTFNSTFADQPALGAGKTTQGIWLASGVGQDVTINASVTSAVLTITGNATLNGQTNAGIIMSDTTNNHNLTIGPKTSIFLSNNTGFYNQESPASTLLISGGLDLNAKTLTIGLGASSTGNVTISGNITSASGGNITINSAATVALSGTNTYAGATTLSAGTLKVGVDSVGSVGSITSSAVGKGTLALNGGSLSSNGTTARTILNAVTLGGNVTLGDASNNGKLTFSATADLGGGTRTLTAASDVQLDGIVSNGGLTKAGAGTLTLTAANTYTGATNISGGTLVAGNVAAFGGSLTAGVFISTSSGAGTLRLSTDTSVNAYTIRSSSANQGTIVSDRATAGAGITHVLGAAQLGGNTYNITKGSNVTSGGAAISFASINVAGGAGSTTKLNPTTADLFVPGAVNIGSASGNKTLELGGTSQGSAIPGVISDNSNGATGTLSLTKSGAGTWTLSGVNTYTGVTAINGGILQIGNGTGDGSISTSSGIVNNGSLQFNIVANQSYGNIISGNGTVTQAGPGTQTLSGSNTYTGATSISYGALSVGSTANLGAASSNLVFNGGVLQVTGTTLTSFSGIGHTVSFNAAKTVGLDINSASNTFTVDSVLNQTTGGFTKLGAGTAVLNQANTFAGNTSVNAGSLILANANALQNSTLNVAGTGAGVVFSQTVAGHAFNVGGLAANGAIALQDNASIPNAVTLTVGSNNANTTSAGVLSGSGGLTKTGAGTLTLSGNNSFTGATVISGGTLRLGRSTLPTGLNILPMGDSITYGDRGSNAGYRGPLYNLLNPVAFGFNYVGSLNTVQANISLPSNQLHHDGYSGRTAADLTALNLLAPGNGINPNVILLQIGTNDLLTYGGGYTAQLKTNYEALLTQLTNNRPDANIILANITPSSKRTGIAQYNAMVNTVAANFQAAGKHVTVVDNNTYFPASGLSDGTHPNDSGYNWLANQWYSALFTLYSDGGTSNALTGSTTVTVAAGATLDVNNNVATIGALGGAGSVTLGGGALTISSTAGNNSTFSGVISGAGSVTKTGVGTLTLSGTNTYTGVTTISAGTLVLSGGGTIDSSPEIKLGTLASQGTLDLTAKAAGATTGVAQKISGYGNVLMAAGQTLTVSGTLAPGNSAGKVTVAGNLALSGITLLELIDNTLAAGIGYDQVSLTGATPALTYGGTLTLNIVGSPQSGIYHLFTGFNAQSGTFSAINFSVSGYTGSFDYATGDLTLSAVPEPATWALLAASLVLAGGIRRRMWGQAS